MFCHKCGSKIADSAAFCPECGEKVVPLNHAASQGADTVAAPDAQRAAGIAAGRTQLQTNDAPSDRPKKKKSKKLPVILGAAVLAIVVIVIAMNWDGKIDYTATVRAHQPFAVSQGLSYTYGEVFDKYITSAKWKVRESGGVNYVDIHGAAKGTDKEITVTIKVSPDSKDPDIALISPEAVTVDSEKTSTDDETVGFLLAMFMAYDEKYNDLSNFSELLSGIDAALYGEASLTETYTNDKAGISFKYPEGWVILDPESEFDVVKMISSRNNAGNAAEFQVSYILDQDPFGVFTGDEASIREAVNEYHTFIKFENVLISGIPAKGVMYQTAGLKGDDIVTNFWYVIGDNVCQITCSYSASRADNYEPIFSAVMDSYAITASSTSGESKTAYSGGFPLTVSTDATNIFAEWAAKHPLIGEYYLGLISDDEIDNDGNKIFLFSLETSNAGIFNMSIRKADGYMEYISKFDTMSMDDWYDSWFTDSPDNGDEHITNDLYFKGVSLTPLLGKKPEVLYDIFGAPTSGTPVDGRRYEGGEYYGYQGISFVIDYQTETIGWIVGRPDLIEANRVTLDKNRTGIINALGTPGNEDTIYNEADNKSSYVMEYSSYDGGVITTITIEMPDADSRADNIIISQYLDS